GTRSVRSSGIRFFFSSRRRHTRFSRDWSSDVCSSDLKENHQSGFAQRVQARGDPYPLHAVHFHQLIHVGGVDHFCASQFCIGKGIDLLGRGRGRFQRSALFGGKHSVL